MLISRLEEAPHRNPSTGTMVSPLEIPMARPSCSVSSRPEVPGRQQAPIGLGSSKAARPLSFESRAHAPGRTLGILALELCTSAARTIATSAENVSTALAACEYSHCRRTTSNDSGRTVQKSVAALTG